MTDYYEIMYFVYRFSMAFELGYIVLFLPMRYSKPKTAAIVIAAFAVTASLDYIDFFVYELANGIANTLLQVAIVQGVAMLVSAYRDWRTVFTALCAANYVLVGNVIGTSVYTFSKDIVPALVSEVVIHSLLLTWLLLSIRKNYHLELEAGNNDWTYVCLIPVMFYAIIYAMAAWPNSIQETPEISVPLYFVLLLMAVNYYYMLNNRRRLRGAMKKASEAKLLENYAEAMLHESELMQKHRQALAIQRHDLRHQYRLIETYLECGQYDEIRQLTRQLDAELDTLTERSFCENRLVNGLLSLYSEKAERENVTFECKADVPDDLELANDFGFATMLSNLIENALLAAANVKNSGNRRLVISMMPRKEKLILEIQNTSDKQLIISPETGFPIADKGRNGHGYGLVSVSNYADEHGALIKFRQRDDMVIVQFVTNL